jgi:hypothetical protein
LVRSQRAERGKVKIIPTAYSYKGKTKSDKNLGKSFGLREKGERIE